MTSAVALPGPSTPDPTPDSTAGSALAPMVEVWFQMLRDHVPDENLCCVACTHGGTGARSTPWPCALRGLAEEARREFGGAPVAVPAPRQPVDDAVPARVPASRRRLRGPHGITRILTPREQEYLQLAVDGADDGDIARRLGTPERTVGTSIRRIMRTLGITDRSTLLVLALRDGVIR